MKNLEAVVKCQKSTFLTKNPKNPSDISKSKTAVFCQKPSMPVENSKHKISQRIINIAKQQTSILSAEKNRKAKTLSDISKSKTVIFCQKPPLLPVENSKPKIAQRITGIFKPETSTLSAEKNKNPETLSDISKSKSVICCQKPPSLAVENLNPNISLKPPIPKPSN